MSGHDIASFVSDALVRSKGAAFWEIPGTSETVSTVVDSKSETWPNGLQIAKGALNSPYILKVFAFHLKNTQDSIITENEKILCALPRGALALTVTAVS